MLDDLEATLYIPVLLKETYKNHKISTKVPLTTNHFMMNYNLGDTLNFLKLYGPFLWMGFNCLKARATSRRQFTFYR